MEVLSVAGKVTTRESGLDAELDDGWSLRIDALDTGLLRIAVLPPEGLAADRSWMIAAGGDTPLDGRPKLSVDGFPGLAVAPLADGDAGFAAADIRVQLTTEPLRLDIDRRAGDGGWRTLLADRGSGGYAVTDGGQATCHHQQRPAGDRHFGLGDMPGPLDRTGQRFRLPQADAPDRDGETGEPRREHVPVLIVRDGDSGAAAGLLYDTAAEATFDLGTESTQLDGHCRHAEARERGLVCYVLIGPDVPSVVERLTALTGRPDLLARRALGFGFSSTGNVDAPDKRPCTTARPGPFGFQDHAGIWSGGTAAGWPALKRGLRQSLSLSLSGLPLPGHDIGGFDGSQAEPEMLLRWVQLMALQPRSVMNSRHAGAGDGTPPWIHEGVSDDIGTALRLRYTFLPYIYTLAYRAHATGQPIIRPLFYASDEREAFADHDAFLLGDHVLVAPVVAPGATSKRVYLPEVPGGWINFWAAELYGGGQEVELDAPPGRLPVLIRVGAVLPLAREIPDDRPHDAEEVALAAFPGIGSGAGAPSHAFFDDGEGFGYREGSASLIDLGVSWEPDSVLLEGVERMSGEGRPDLSIMMVDPMARAGTISGDFGMISTVWERRFPF